MAFPTVESVTETANATNSTDHSFDLPPTVASGDLLLALITIGPDPAAATEPTGWTRHYYSNTGFTDQILYSRVADGTEGGGTLDITVSAGPGNSSTSTGQLYRISGWHGTVSGGMDFTRTGGLDPPSLSPTWAGASVDTLWIAWLSSGDDDVAVTGVPTNYASHVETFCGGGTNNSGKTDSARRENAVATEDPDSWSLASSETTFAGLIAVRPGTSGGGGGGQTVGAPVAAATVSAPDTSPAPGASTVSAPAALATASAPAVQPAASVGLASPVAPSTASAPTPSPAPSVGLASPLAQVLAEAPTVTPVPGAASVSSPVAPGTTAAPAPTVSTVAQQTVSAPVAPATAEAPAPQVAATVTVASPAGLATVQVPAVGLLQGVSLSAAVAPALAEASAPGVSPGPATVASPVAEALADAPSPAVAGAAVSLSAPVAGVDVEALPPALQAAISLALGQVEATASAPDTTLLPGTTSPQAPVAVVTVEVPAMGLHLGELITGFLVGEPRTDPVLHGRPRLNAKASGIPATDPKLHGRPRTEGD